MDLTQFASDPSDSLWVRPGWREQHCHIITFHSHGHAHHDHQSNDKEGSEDKTPDTMAHTPQREALHDAAAELNRLCARNDPVATVKDFVRKWEDPVGRIQPNALAWFSDTNAVESACEHVSKDLLRLLLEKGLQPVKRAVRTASICGRKVNEYGCVRLLVEFGLNIHQPIQSNVPPVLR